MILILLIALVGVVTANIEIGKHFDTTSPYYNNENALGIFTIDQPIHPHDYGQLRKITFQWINMPRIKDKYRNIVIEFSCVNADKYYFVQRVDVTDTIRTAAAIEFEIETDELLKGCANQGPYFYPFLMTLYDMNIYKVFYESALIYLNIEGYGRLRADPSDDLFRRVFAAMSDKELLDNLIRQNQHRKYLIQRYVLEISSMRIDPNIEMDTSTDNVCTICTDELTLRDIAEGKVKDIPCGHGFHRECIDKWSQSKTICPNCNVPFEA